MNKRVQKLREQSVRTHPSLSSERAEIVTEFYRDVCKLTDSIPVQRALSFKYLMEKKHICLNEGELIVGERGPAPQETPTYPEVCIHTVEDLETLDGREKVSFSADEKTKEAYRDTIIPFWEGKSLRDKIMQEVSPEWKDAYGAGVFTEFMEQRSPGHTVLGDKIYKKGFSDFKAEIDSEISSLDFFNDSEALDKRDQLMAMSITCDGIISYANRYAEKLSASARIEKDPTRKIELELMAAMSARVPEHKPETFWEALQYYWYVHVGVITELNPWDAFNPGRLDQHLYPFYLKELEEGTLTEEKARELLCCFWVKFNNHPAPPKVGITSQESNTYVDFALINTGGLKRDGSNAVNELSYMILDVVEEMRLLQPSSMVQVSKKTPDRFVRRALKIIQTGFGQPSVFNTDTIVQELVRQGKSVEDARDGGASGCVESGAFGRECYILTGYFNLTKILEITMNNGLDKRTGKRLGIETGQFTDFHNYEDFFGAFKKQLTHFADIKIKGNNIIERIYARFMPAPFLSVVIDDCIKKGKDYTGGGARYNTSYVQGVGLGTITDCLSSLKKNIFEDKIVGRKELLGILERDFDGHEDIRETFISGTPKWGNDDDFADDLARDVFEAFYDSVNGRPNAKGGSHRIMMLPTTSHVYFGSVIGATPDGRKKGIHLSEGISPVQGTDTNGPGAVVKSAAKLDHIRTGGTLLNQRFVPSIFDGERGLHKLTSLIRSYFKLDGHHIQFNVVDSEILLKAQKEPESYRDLIVRVAGYSDYFINLTPELQNEIILRTGHEEC